jgi:hypothetical protein
MAAADPGAIDDQDVRAGRECCASTERECGVLLTADNGSSAPGAEVRMIGRSGCSPGRAGRDGTTAQWVTGAANSRSAHELC